MSFIASIGASALAWLLKKTTGDFLKDVFGKLTSSDGGNEKMAEINAMSTIALKKEDTAQLALVLASRLSHQTAKMNWPVFWIMIAIMMGPPALIMWSVAIYNILFWENGIWPQGWAIADFPASIKPWAQAAIDWLYDPVAAPLGVGSALVAGKITGGKR